MRTSFHGYSVRLMQEHDMTSKHIIYLDWFLRWRDTGKMKEKKGRYWVNHRKAVEDLGPIVGHTARDSARNAFTKLVEAGLLTKHTTNDNKTFYGLNGNELAKWRTDIRYKKTGDTPSESNRNPSESNRKGQSYDVHKTSNSTTRDKEGGGNKEKEKNENDENQNGKSQTHTPYKKIVEFWNEEIAEPNDLSKRLKPGALKPNILKKWREFAKYDREHLDGDGDPWKTYELIKELIESCAFLRGDYGVGDDSWNGATFMFLFKNRDSWDKILTGYYHNHGTEHEKDQYKRIILGEDYDPWKHGNWS